MWPGRAAFAARISGAKEFYSLRKAGGGEASASDRRGM
jgi:hypothetical protein